jgi:hypothetical protein
MAKLLNEIETFMALTGMSARDVGMFSVGDPNLVFGLRHRRSPREKTIIKVRAWMDDFLDRHRVIDLDRESVE